jgi:hypothetical protein
MRFMTTNQNKQSCVEQLWTSIVDMFISMYTHAVLLLTVLFGCNCCGSLFSNGYKVVLIRSITDDAWNVIDRSRRSRRRRRREQIMKRIQHEIFIASIEGCARVTFKQMMTYVSRCNMQISTEINRWYPRRWVKHCLYTLIVLYSAMAHWTVRLNVDCNVFPELNWLRYHSVCLRWNYSLFNKQCTYVYVQISKW